MHAKRGLQSCAWSLERRSRRFVLRTEYFERRALIDARSRRVRQATTPGIRCFIDAARLLSSVPLWRS
jgi:hypothetical protein